MLNSRVAAWLIFGLHFAIFLAINQLLNPHPDMVDHWIWGQDLRLSYYEHPPMVAVVFRILTMLLGDSETAMEAGAQLVNLLVLAGLWAVARRTFGPQAALATLLVLCGMPYFTIGSIFLHITQPFMLSWVAALYCWIRWQEARNDRWLWGIGVAAGFGALSKYIMVLFYVGMMLHFTLYREQRREWLNWRVYAAGALSLLLFTPVLWWNAENDWISFRWQLGRGTSGADFGENTIFFTIGHLLLFSPVWFLAGAWTLVRLREFLKDGRTPEAAIALVSVLPIGFFTAMSLKGSIADPHWANLTYMGMALLLGRELTSGSLQRWKGPCLAAGLALNALSVGLLLWHSLNPLFDWLPYELKNYQYLQAQGVPEPVLDKLRQHDHRYYSTPVYREELRKVLGEEEVSRWGTLLERVAQDVSGDRFTRFQGWEETSRQLEQLLREHQLPEIRFIISREYQLSSALAYWTPQSPRPWPHSIEKPERNQWSPVEEVRKGPSLFVCELWECEQNQQLFRTSLGLGLELLGEIEVRRNQRLLRDLLVFRILPEAP